MDIPLCYFGNSSFRFGKSLSSFGICHVKMEKRRNSKFSEDLKLYVISNTIEFATIELTIRAASLVVSLDSEAVIVQSV